MVYTWLDHHGVKILAPSVLYVGQYVSFSEAFHTKLKGHILFFLDHSTLLTSTTLKSLQFI